MEASRPLTALTTTVSPHPHPTPNHSLTRTSLQSFHSFISFQFNHFEWFHSFQCHWLRSLSSHSLARSPTRSSDPTHISHFSFTFILTNTNNISVWRRISAIYFLDSVVLSFFLPLPARFRIVFFFARWPVDKKWTIKKTKTANNMREKLFSLLFFFLHFSCVPFTESTVLWINFKFSSLLYSALFFISLFARFPFGFFHSGFFSSFFSVRVWPFHLDYRDEILKHDNEQKKAKKMNEWVREREKKRTKTDSNEMKTGIEVKLIANVEIDIGAAIEHPHHLGSHCMCLCVEGAKHRHSNNRKDNLLLLVVFSVRLWCQPTGGSHSDALIRTQFLTSGECAIGRERERAHTYSCNKSIIQFRNDYEDASMWLTLSDYIDNSVAILTRAQFFFPFSKYVFQERRRWSHTFTPFTRRDQYIRMLHLEHTMEIGMRQNHFETL